MQGTAATESAEFYEVYNLSVSAVPPHKPSIRVDHTPTLLFNSMGLNIMLCHLLHMARCQNRPVLIGTTSVEESERVCWMLQHGLQRCVLEVKTLGRARVQPLVLPLLFHFFWCFFPLAEGGVEFVSVR